MYIILVLLLIYTTQIHPTSLSPINISNIISTPITSSLHPSSPKQIVQHITPIQVVEPQTHTLTHRDVPSTFNNECFDLTLALANISRSDKVGPKEILDRILDRVSEIPSKPQLQKLMNSITDEVNASLECSSLDIDQNLKRITETLTNVPEQMSKSFREELKAFLKDIVKNLKKKDEIFFERIQKQRKVVLVLQDSNSKKISALTDKVLELSSSLNDFK